MATTVRLKKKAVHMLVTLVSLNLPLEKTKNGEFVLNGREAKLFANYVGNNYIMSGTKPTG